MQIIKIEIESIYFILNEECSRMSNLDYGEDQCETTSDIFIMIDNNVLKYSYFQLELIKNLLVKLKSLNYLGTITVLANAHSGYSPDIQQMSTNFNNLRIQLHLIAYNTTSIEQATCRLAWYPYRKFIFSLQIFIEILNF